MISDPDIEEPALPDFVLDKVPMVALRGGEWKRGAHPRHFLEPRYDHPFFQDAFRELNGPCGRIRRQPLVEYVDTFMYGFWGEGHTWPSRTTRFRTLRPPSALSSACWSDSSSPGNGRRLRRIRSLTGAASATRNSSIARSGATTGYGLTPFSSRTSRSRRFPTGRHGLLRWSRPRCPTARRSPSSSTKASLTRTASSRMSWTWAPTIGRSGTGMRSGPRTSSATTTNIPR